VLYCLLQDGDTPLSIAAENDRDDLVKCMIEITVEKTADINFADKVSLLYTFSVWPHINI